MKRLFIICQFIWIISSCHKEEQVVPFYPRTLNLKSHDWHYQAWLKGQMIQDNQLMDTFFYKGVQQEIYQQSIEFLNDSLLRFGPLNANQNPFDDSYFYYFRQDSLFYLMPSSSILLGNSKQTYIEKLIGMGNRSAFTVKWSMIGFKIIEIKQWGPLFSIGNYNWQSLSTFGLYESPGPMYFTSTDTLRILNCIDSYSLTY